MDWERSITNTLKRFDLDDLLKMSWSSRLAVENNNRSVLNQEVDKILEKVLEECLERKMCEWEKEF